MNKKDILNVLSEYLLDCNDFVVISGAALVIHGIQEKTNDIDIAVSEDLYKKLLKKYDCIFEKSIGDYSVYFIDNVINFSVHYYSEIDYIICCGYKIQTVDSILDLKQSLNRDKDKDDIEKILYYKKQLN